MSTTRRASGTKTPDKGHSWAEETFTKPLPVMGAWTTSRSGPVVWADAASRLDVTDLARGHREASEGTVFTQWMLALSPGMGVRVLLLVRFKRPVRTEFALAFGPGHLEVLANMAMAGTVSMVTREPKVGHGTIEGRNAVSFEVDQPGLLEVLDKMRALQAMAEVLSALHG